MEDVEKLLNEKLIEQEKVFIEKLLAQEKKHKAEIAEICSSIVNKKLEDLEKKSKKVQESQRKTIDELKEYIKDNNIKIAVLEKDMHYTSKQLEETQRLAYSTDQYLRSMNVEISGIPHELDEDLEDVVIGLVNQLCKEPGKPHDDTELDIGRFDIQACHRLKSKNKDGVQNTIVRFINRKVCENLHSNKSKLKTFKSKELGFSVTNIFINENLNKYIKELSAKCRRLKKKGLINDTWVSKGIVKIKSNDNSIRSITHQNDLEKLFPNFVYFE